MKKMVISGIAINAHCKLNLEEEEKNGRVSEKCTEIQTFVF